MSSTHPDIVTIDRPENEKFLHQKTLPVSFGPNNSIIAPDGTMFSATEVTALLARMRKIMKQAIGIGLAANQIGLPYRLFIAAVPSADGSETRYAIFNPEIEKKSPEQESFEEGCLSVPGKYGEITRASRVTVRGLDKRGKPLKIKAWGLLAQVFQHEIDHLDGMLYIDKAARVYDRMESEHWEARDRRMKK